MTVPEGIGFSPPKGIQVFVTSGFSGGPLGPGGSFSPPKGIQVFVTEVSSRAGARSYQVSVPRRGFRSLLLACNEVWVLFDHGFSPPKGIQVFVT